MAHSEQERKALGQRLAAARKLAGYTSLEAVAAELKMTKGAVGHWETGKNVPDALRLRQLARLYETTVDALMGDESLSAEAIRVARQFDHLDDPQKAAFKAMADTYFEKLKAQGQGKSGASLGSAIKRKAA